VAHEVNNPLTAILGFADLLADSPDIPVAAKKDLAMILQEAQRTKLIVQNLLSFARKMPPQRQLVQLNSVVRRTLQLRAYDFANHGVEVVEKLQESLTPIWGDPNQLQQVLLNILNNAYDAVLDTSRPGRIEIATEQRDGFSQIIVRDNGAGVMHPERIFDPFFTTKKVGKGTGLGLSICYGIVRDHRGEVLCHNNENGPGATFVVRLPAALDKAVAGMTLAKIITASPGQA
jgi:two-component system NtrC family sensor kinase